MYRKQEAVERHSVSLAWRLDREMRRQLILHETKRKLLAKCFLLPTLSTSMLFTCLWIDLVRMLATPEISLRSQAIREYKYTKIQGPRFQRNYIIVRDKKVIKNGTSFQSSPKINRMLISRQFAYSESLQHPTIAVLLIKILLLLLFFFFDYSEVFTCSKVINACKR